MSRMGIPQKSGISHFVVGQSEKRIIFCLQKVVGIIEFAGVQEIIRTENGIETETETETEINEETEKNEKGDVVVIATGTGTETGNVIGTRKAIATENLEDVNAGGDSRSRLGLTVHYIMSTSKFYLRLACIPYNDDTITLLSIFARSALSMSITTQSSK